MHAELVESRGADDREVQLRMTRRQKRERAQRREDATLVAAVGDAHDQPRIRRHAERRFRAFAHGVVLRDVDGERRHD